MNFEHAKTIPLRQILEKIGYLPTTETADSLTYQSPFSKEAEHTLAVNIEDNTWLDLAIDKGGSAVDLVCEFLQHSGENCSIADGMRWFGNMFASANISVPKAVNDYAAFDQKYIITKVGDLSKPYLIKYLEEARQIPFEIAKPLLKEALVLNQKTGKDFWVVAVINEDGGFAIRNQYLKANLGPTKIKFIRGKKVKPEGVHVFKDFMDYLSVLDQRNGEAIDDDTIILNSYLSMKDAAAYIQKYGYKRAHTWFDNGTLGKEVTQAFNDFFKTEPNLKHYPENKTYLPFYDVNLWHIAKGTSQ